jgi:hypothetical protein
MKPLLTWSRIGLKDCKNYLCLYNNLKNKN